MDEHPMPMTQATFFEWLRFGEYPVYHVELVDGVVVEKAHPTQQQGAVQAHLAMLLLQHADEHKPGRVYASASYAPSTDHYNVRGKIEGDEVLTDGDVLPGFSVTVRELFE